AFLGNWNNWKNRPSFHRTERLEHQGGRLCPDSRSQYLRFSISGVRPELFAFPECSTCAGRRRYGEEYFDEESQCTYTAYPSAGGAAGDRAGARRLHRPRAEPGVGTGTAEEAVR